MAPGSPPIPPPPAPFRVGAWHVDPGGHALHRDGQAVRVEPKVMALLLTLAARPGRTVSRDALMAEVWPDVVVTEDALSRAVFKLRTALGDDAQQPAYVETIPKAGYRLIAAVEPADEPVAQARHAPFKAPWRWAAWSGLALVVAGLAALLLRPEATAPTVRPVTHLPGVEQHPALSAHGQRLAFVASPRDGERLADLYVQGLDEATPLRLTDSPEAERHPVWLADGRIGFLRCEGFTCGVFAVSAQGGGVQRVLDAAVGPWGFSASADGTMLVAAARTAPEAPYELVRLDLTRGSRTAFTTPPAGSVGDLSPAVAPDGRRVAFVRHGVEGEEQILVQALEPGAAPRVLARDGVPIAGLAWTADGRALVYAANRDGTDALWRVDADGGTPERLAAGALGSPRSPTLRAGRLVFEAHATEVNLYARTLGDGAAGTWQPVVVSTGVDEQPALHPDGERLAFVSDRSGAPELWTAALDGSALVRLTDFGGVRVGAPRWSPDGRWIAFEVQADGTGSLYRIGADGGTPQPLTDDDGYDFAPRWSPDGRQVYFASNRGGRAGVWRVGRDGGPPERLTEAGGFVGEPTADGRALLFMHTAEPGLWRQPLSGGPATRLDSTLDVRDWGNWAVTPQGVLLIDRTAGDARLVRIDPASGARQILAEAPGLVPARVPALAVSADGRRVVVARIDRIESALVLAEPGE